jgi:hypothetical protein
MGNYRQHLAFASTLGVSYGVAAFFLAGLHWLYGSVAVLLATLGGLLPDLDSPSGVGLKGFTGILGVLGAMIVWQEVGQVNPPPVFEVHLWAMVCTFLMIRHGLSRIMIHLTVHRGISHSFPTLAVWAELVYLHYPSESHIIRLMMGLAVAIGFFSHLLLDEICSVDLRGARLNKAFGTAMKFWAPSIFSTVGIYGLLTYLTWQAIKQWPDQPFTESIEIRMPEWPANWPKPRWPESWPKPSWVEPTVETLKHPVPPAGPRPNRGGSPGGDSDGPGGISDFPSLRLPGRK